MQDNILYIRLDVDNVGDAIETALYNLKFQEANDIQNKIKEGMKYLLEIVNKYQNAIILMNGCDDIFFSLSSNSFDKKQFQSIIYKFQEITGFTLSIGIGHTPIDALHNLHLAKISGKNKTIFSRSETEDNNYNA